MIAMLCSPLGCNKSSAQCGGKEILLPFTQAQRHAMPLLQQLTMSRVDPNPALLRTTLGEIS